MSERQDTAVWRWFLGVYKKMLLDPWLWASVGLFLVAYAVGGVLNLAYDEGVLVGALIGIVGSNFPTRNYFSTNTEE